MKYYLGEMKYRPTINFVKITRLIYANDMAEAEQKFFKYCRDAVPSQYHDYMLMNVIETI